MNELARLMQLAGLRPVEIAPLTESTPNLLRELDEKYVGFDKLKGKLAHQKGVEDPGALAASIGRKKYGKNFQKAAAAGKKMDEGDVVPFTGNKKPVSHLPIGGAKVHNFEPRRDLTEIDDFLKGYIKCALWSSEDNDNTDDAGAQPLEDSFTAEDIAPETLKQMQQDCADFVQANAELIQQSGLPDITVGIDFWLDRNGHGAGFWDRGLGKIGDELSKAAKVYGEYYLYVGDDDLIHGS